MVEPHHSSRSDMDDEMKSRSTYRGGHNYKSHYGTVARRYSQSPPHGGSFEHSQSTSPYPNTRPGRNGQHTPER